MLIIRRYERTFLNTQDFRSKIVKRYWKLKYFAVVFLSYVACAFPWVLKHVGTVVIHRPMHEEFLSDSAVLMFYIVNFYFPSGVIAYLWYKQRSAKKIITKLYEFAERANLSVLVD